MDITNQITLIKYEYDEKNDFETFIFSGFDFDEEFITIERYNDGVMCVSCNGIRWNYIVQVIKMLIEKPIVLHTHWENEKQEVFEKTRKKYE